MAADDKKTRMGTGAYPNSGVAPVPTPAPGTTGAPSWGETTRQTDHPAAAVAAVSTPPAYVPPTDPLLGQVLAGRYLIQKKLGEGGMGAVYLAQHTVLEKAVALKVLHGEFARKPDLVERFMQEAKAASRIRHENVIDISDFGATNDGLVFFAMELLSGHDLHEEVARARLAQQRLPWERSRKIFLQICSALAAAHAQGIVHRDLKPENIYLVEWLGHKDFVKLLDFGIAKLTEVSEGDRKLTRTGMLFGTPEYMSPEQARGDQVDHRVDIYAMGCILYQLCTGRVPFEAENFMGILSLHLTEPPPPIGAPILNEIGAPLELEAIVMKALEKSRDQRWSTIDEMANAIRALHGEAAHPVLEPTVPRAATTPAGTRQKTEWKGNLQVPVEDDRPTAAKKSPLPWIVAGVLLVGGGVAAAVVALGGKKGAAAGEGAVTPPAMIDAGAALPEALPARVTIKLDSVPQGADIYDTTTKEVVGQTPFEFMLPGSRDPRRYTFKLVGYGGKMIELLPVEDVQFTAELVKLAGTSATAAVAEPAEVEVVPQKARPGRKPVVVDKPGTGGTPAVDGPVTTPDRPPVDKPPVDKPAVDKPDKPPVDKPGADKPDKPPVDKPPPDDDEPVIKNPFATGGGAATP